VIADVRSVINNDVWVSTGVDDGRQHVRLIRADEFNPPSQSWTALLLDIDAHDSRADEVIPPHSQRATPRAEGCVTPNSNLEDEILLNRREPKWRP